MNEKAYNELDQYRIWSFIRTSMTNRLNLCPRGINYRLVVLRIPILDHHHAIIIAKCINDDKH